MTSPQAYLIGGLVLSLEYKPNKDKDFVGPITGALGPGRFSVSVGRLDWGVERRRDGSRGWTDGVWRTGVVFMSCPHWLGLKSTQSDETGSCRASFYCQNDLDNCGQQ